MNDNDICLICKEDLKPGKQLLTILVKGDKGILLHKWCLGELECRELGKDVV